MVSQKPDSTVVINKFMKKLCPESNVAVAFRVIIRYIWEAHKEFKEIVLTIRLL